MRPDYKYQEAYPLDYAAGTAEMDFGTSPAVIQALSEAVSECRLGYLDDLLARQVQASCAVWLGHEFKWEVEPAWVRLVPDAAGAIAVAQEAFGKPGATVLYCSPLYGRLWRSGESLGMKSVPVPLTIQGARYRYDIDAIEKALAGVDEPIIMLCNPHNPTGSVALREELEALSILVHRHGGFVISDEIHSALTFSSATHVPYASVSEEARLHTVTITSTSKGWNTSGLKCAQVIMANVTHRDLWDRTPQAALLTNSTSRLGAVAADAAYRDRTNWRSQVISTLEENARQLGQWVDGIADISMIGPEASYLAWLRFSNYKASPDRDAASRFSAAGIHVQSGQLFDLFAHDHIRLNFASHRETLASLLSAASRGLRPEGTISPESDRSNE